MGVSRGEAAMNVERVESFRTSLMTQKQRLLKQTQLQNTIDKAKLDSDLKKKEEEQKSTKEIIFGALRKISGGSRKNSKEQKVEAPKPESPSPGASPGTFLKPESSPACPAPPVLPSPKQERTRTPVPSDSPLLSKVRPDPILKRIRSFNKSLKKASSFRAGREKNSELGRERVEAPVMMLNNEITFKVRKSKLGRTGWKIMPEDQTLNLRINRNILNDVLERIRTMEYSGEVVPEKITIVVDK